MRRVGRWMAAAFVLLLAAGAHAEVVDRIVAVVNESIITASELDAATAVIAKGFRPGVNETIDKGALKQDVLDSLIEKKLVRQAADRAGIGVSDVEIENAIEEVRLRNGVKKEELLLVLARAGITYGAYREQITEEIRKVKFLQREIRSKVRVSEEDMKDYYMRNKARFSTGGSMRLGLIFLARDDRLGARLDAVVGELKGGSDFASVAADYTDGPAADSGGDIGFIKEGDVAKPIEAVAKKLAIGEVSEPVVMKKGVYIIRLIERDEGEVKPFKEVKEVVHSAVFEKIMVGLYRLWVEDARDAAHIEIRLVR